MIEESLTVRAAGVEPGQNSKSQAVINATGAPIEILCPLAHRENVRFRRSCSDAFPGSLSLRKIEPAKPLEGIGKTIGLGRCLFRSFIAGGFRWRENKTECGQQSDCRENATYETLHSSKGSSTHSKNQVQSFPLPPPRREITLSQGTNPCEEFHKEMRISSSSRHRSCHMEVA